MQIPAGEIGVVIAQVGEQLPIGAKSAIYKKEFGDFADLRSFVAHGGQKGVQRPVLPPGHDADSSGGVSGDNEAARLRRANFAGVAAREDRQGRRWFPRSGGWNRRNSNRRGSRRCLVAPRHRYGAVGIVTTLDGDPLPSGAIAEPPRRF